MKSPQDDEGTCRHIHNTGDLSIKQNRKFGFLYFAYHEPDLCLLLGASYLFMTEDF
jgi:hypothetical protein